MKEVASIDGRFGVCYIEIGVRTENRQKKGLALWIEMIAVLAFLGSLIMWIFTKTGDWKVWLPVVVVSIIVFFVTDDKLDPKLPDDFFKKIKDGTYRFDI